MSPSPAQEALVQIQVAVSRGQTQTSITRPVTENSEEVEGVTSLFVCFQDGAGLRLDHRCCRDHGGI